MTQVSKNALQAFQHETEFLSGVEANFESAKGKQFRGSIWKQSRHDEGDHLRAIMAKHHCYDREMLKSLPSNRRVTLRGFDRSWLWWTRATSVASASVLSPLESFFSGDGEAPPPVGLGTLVDHVRGIVGNSKLPHVIGVCSPTGFSDDVMEGRLEIPNVTLVLVEPSHGGWKVFGANKDVDPSVLRIFDPEGSKQKLERVQRVIEASSATLLTGSLSVAQVAKESDLPVTVVARAFEQVAQRDPELRLTRQDGELLLFRGVATSSSEKTSMNVIDRIKKLFSGEGNAVDQANELASRRAALTQRRDRLISDVAELEGTEAKLLEAGKASKSAVSRKRMAAQLAQLRKEMRRQHTTLNMLNQQVNIISTDIHNLSLIQQGKMADLPSSEELTEHAVAAEEMLETLKSDAEMVQTLETDQAELVTSDEELDILKEFEDADQIASSSAEPTSPQRVEQPPTKAAQPEHSVTRSEPEPTTFEPDAAPTSGRKEKEPPAKDAEPT